MTELANYLTPDCCAGVEWNELRHERTPTAITARPSVGNRVVVEYFVSVVVSMSDGERAEKEFVGE